MSSRDPYKTPVARNRSDEPAQTADDPAPAAVSAPAQNVAPEVRLAETRPLPPPDTRDVSAAVSRWAQKSLADLVAGKGLGAAPAPNGQNL